MVQPKVFISAPVTGRDREERKRFFRQVEQNLKDLGFYPVNPMKNGAPSTAKHATHMKASLRKLLCSDYYIQALDQHFFTERICRCRLLRCHFLALLA